jgi:hypothetical protein
MKRVWFLVGLVSIAFIMGGPVVSAYAQAKKPMDIEQRIANQEKRITQAVQAKELTPDDAKMLQGNVAKIKEESTRLKTENKLTKEARDKLNASLDQNSDLINQKRQATAKPAPTAPAKVEATAPATVPAAAKPAATAPAAGPAPAKPAPTSPGVPAEVKPAVTAPPPAQQTGTLAPPAPKAPAAPVKVLPPNPPDPKVQQGIANQQKRIDEGVKNGQLSLNESKTVQANLNAIRDEDNTLRAQGQLTNEQKDRLLKALDQNNKMITNKKSNPVRDMGKDISLAQRVRTLQERYARQQTRISEGIKSKELSPDEARLLQDNLNFIKNQDARMKAAGGGELTNPQKNELHKLLDQNSEMIENKKDNPVKALK